MDIERVRTHRSLEILDIVALVLLFIGGLNWGLVGLFNFNLVHAIFGFSIPLERIIYILVGISAIYMAVVTPYVLKRHYMETARPAPPTTPSF